jgi:hypothetical protein
MLDRTVRRPFRPSHAKFLGGLGFTAGTFYAVLSSTQRFMGLEPNPHEVKTYGEISPEALAEFNRRAQTPNIGMIDAEADD